MLSVSGVILFSGCLPHSQRHVETKFESKRDFNYTAGTGQVVSLGGPAVVVKPLVADLKIADSRVTKTVRRSATFGLSVSELKKMAIARALNDSAADVLIAPRFRIVQEGSALTVTVRGYPATYIRIRPMTTDDLPLLKAGSQNSTANKNIGYIYVSSPEVTVK